MLLMNMFYKDLANDIGEEKFIGNAEFYILVAMSSKEFPYSYEELLERAYKLLPKKVTVRVERFKVPRPEVVISGKRTFIQNFKQICDILNRDPKIVLRYLLRELAAPGVLEGNTAVIMGEKSERVIRSIIDRFVKDYVICPVCKQPDTSLVKEKKMMFIVCMACGAKSAVRPI